MRAGRQARHRAPGAVALVQGAPVVPRAGDRRVQGRALHARARRRRRPQAAEPRGPGLAHAGRPVPGADDRAGRDRGRPGRPRRPAHARGTGRGGQLGRPHDQRRRLARRVGAAQDRAADRAAQPAGQEARRRSSSCTSTTRTSSTRSRSPGRTARTRRRPGTACSATPSGPCCARRRPRSRSWRCCRRSCGEFVLWHRRGHLSLRRALRVPGPAAEARRRPGRAVRVRLQPVPRVHEPRRRVGRGAGLDGARRR